jgi:hypothetical protein
MAKRKVQRATDGLQMEAKAAADCAAAYIDLLGEAGAADLARKLCASAPERDKPYWAMVYEFVKGKLDKGLTSA